MTPEYTAQPTGNPKYPWRCQQRGFTGGIIHRTREEAEACAAKCSASAARRERSAGELVIKPAPEAPAPRATAPSAEPTATPKGVAALVLESLESVNDSEVCPTTGQTSKSGVADLALSMLDAGDGPEAA